MLSIRTIDRALQSKDYDRLLSDLARNGLVLPLPLRVQLAESPAGARGLGLRRLVELTYGPTALTRDLVRRLIACQSPGGAVMDAAGRVRCLLTASLAAGLGRALRDHDDRLGELRQTIQPAYQLALDALAQMQRTDALFAGPQDQDPHDRLLTSAFIAYLLLDTPGFASACRGHELLSKLEDRLDDCRPQTAQLIDMARLSRLAPAETATATPTADRPGPASPHLRQDAIATPRLAGEYGSSNAPAAARRTGTTGKAQTKIAGRATQTDRGWSSVAG